VHINILPFFNDVANRTIAVSVTVCLVFKENEVWKMEVHKFDQIDATDGYLCTNL